MKKFLMGAIAATTLLATGSIASAATQFTQIDQSSLDIKGTSNFGAIIDSTGAFSHTFTFTTTGNNDASGFVGTIRLANGGKDIDLTHVDLDGTFLFTNDDNTEPSEHWELLTAALAAGTHEIHVQGTVLTTGTGVDAASYAGTLNLSGVAVPEPGTWALMIMGFGAAGGMLRRKRALALA